MITNIKTRLVKNLGNIPGWRTKRKIVVILSDDWGGSRVPSIESRRILMEKGIDMNSNRFNQFDMLETHQDMEFLFEVLARHKDKMGNHPIITAMCNVANPDFELIKRNGYQEYVYEPFTKTLEKSSDGKKVINLYHDGIKERIFVPQFHGREHLYVKRWMHLLQTDQNAITAFENGFFALDPKDLQIKKGVSAAFDLDDLKELEDQKMIIKDGLDLFEAIFGYRSVSFAAPSLLYNDNLDKFLLSAGVRLIDVGKVQKIPLGKSTYGHKVRYMGQRNRLGQYYIQRNAVFETNLNGRNGIDECLNDIKLAFKWNKPAIISNHRVCFTGGINISNRDKGLYKLDTFFSEVIKKWSDVEFLSLDDINNLMNDNNAI